MPLYLILHLVSFDSCTDGTWKGYRSGILSEVNYTPGSWGRGGSHEF